MTVTRDALAEQVIASFADLFPELTIMEDTQLDSLGMDSLHFVELAFQIEERSHLDLDHVESFQDYAFEHDLKITTVGEVIDGIHNHYRGAVEQAVIACEECGGRTFATLDIRVKNDPEGKGWKPGPHERCVECKSVRPTMKEKI